MFLLSSLFFCLGYSMFFQVTTLCIPQMNLHVQEPPWTTSHLQGMVWSPRRSQHCAKSLPQNLVVNGDMLGGTSPKRDLEFQTQIETAWTHRWWQCCTLNFTFKFFWLEEIEVVKGSSKENLDWWEVWISPMLVFVGVLLQIQINSWQNCRYCWWLRSF